MSFAEQKDEINKLYEAGKFVEVYDMLEKCHKAEPKNLEVIWRFARATFDKAEHETDTAKKSTALHTGMKLIDDGLTFEGGAQCSALYKWKAIYTSETLKLVGTKERIEKSFEIRKLIEKAIELDPKDGTPHFLLGNWCYEVASVGWLTRKIASAIFSEPPNATYDEAETHFLKAAELAPDFKRNLYCLVQTYEAKGDKVKAKEWAQKAAKVKSVTKSDHEIDAKVKAYL